MRFQLSHHAKLKMAQRGIPESVVLAVLDAPQQVVPQDDEISIYQSQVALTSGTMWLVRVVVNDAVDPAVVVTAYATRDMSRYWREP